MSPIRVFVVVLSLVPAVAACAEERLEYAIAIHGGAGGAPPTDEWRRGREEVLTTALTTGRDMLAEDKSSLETVEAVIRILEDSPFFNAGKGAVFNAAGGHELDASMMDGRTHAGGAVGGVTTIKNPITMARHVMNDTRHVLLVADGAETFADKYSEEDGVVRVPNSYFSTDHQRQKLQEAQEREQAEAKDSMGTVGCVALDRDGNLAAGTSTGGLTNKRYGRIGDSPILSTGTYADNATCAVSGTGVGEDFIRYAAAYDVSARMRYLEQPLSEAVHAVLHHPEQLVRGGIIAVDHAGHISMQFNTDGMARAAADSGGRWEISVAE